MSRVFANGPEDPVFNPKSSHTKDYKIVLDAALLNTQRYEVKTKGNVEQSSEWSSTFFYKLF